MKHLVRITTFIAGAMLSFGAIAAEADRQLTIGLSDMRMRVIDLTPADGIAAGFSVGSFDTVLTSAIRPNPTPWWGGVEDTATITGGQAGTLALDLNGRNTGAVVGAAVGTVELSYTVKPTQPVGAAVDIKGVQTVAITLKPNSMLVVDGSAYAGANNWQGLWAAEPQLFVQLKHGEGAPVSVAYFYGRTAVDNFTQKNFQLAYTNIGSADLSVDLAITTSLSVSPVPEPEMYAMFGAGLALVAAAGIRRKRA